MSKAAIERELKSIDPDFKSVTRQPGAFVIKWSNEWSSALNDDELRGGLRRALMKSKSIVWKAAARGCPDCAKGRHEHN